MKLAGNGWMVLELWVGVMAMGVLSVPGLMCIAVQGLAVVVIVDDDNDDVGICSEVIVGVVKVAGW